MGKNINLIKNNLPKSFKVVVQYIDGSKDELVCASWHYTNDFIEYLTTDNMFVQVFKSNIKSLKYDKDYSKIIEELSKQKQEEKK